jgi:hypothetical protein
LALQTYRLQGPDQVISAAEVHFVTHRFSLVLISRQVGWFRNFGWDSSESPVIREVGLFWADEVTPKGNRRSLVAALCRDDSLVGGGGARWSRYFQGRSLVSARDDRCLFLPGYSSFPGLRDETWGTRRACQRLSGGWSFGADGVGAKGNCRSFVVRCGGLLWMTGFFCFAILLGEMDRSWSRRFSELRADPSPVTSRPRGSPDGAPSSGRHNSIPGPQMRGTLGTRRFGCRCQPRWLRGCGMDLSDRF